MADKASKHRPQKEKRQPLDSVVRGVKGKEMEIDEEDLKKISGGYIGETEKNLK